MKTKTYPAVVAILTAAAAASFLHAEPAAPPTPEAAAQIKVTLQIFNKVGSERMAFSRAAPIPQERLEFQTPIIVMGETRMPFAIVSLRDENHLLWQGYVRLEDQEIFLRDTTTGEFRRASTFPRFAAAPAVAEGNPE
jgi:hypothetical protein